MAIEVRVNGETFSLFKQVDISYNQDDFSGEARIIVTEPVNNSSFIKINDLIEIKLDDIFVLTGYVENIDEIENASTHDVSYKARDVVMDIIDSSVPNSIQALADVSTLKDLCQQVIDSLGLDIKVIDNVDAQITDDIKGAAVGQKCYEYLNSYARRAGVFLNRDGEGNVLLQRPSEELVTQLVLIKDNANNNIKESRISLDYRKRYGIYRVIANNNVSSDGNTDGLGAIGEAIDSDIRSSRVFEKIGESTMTATECQIAAEEEANIRRQQSFTYTCTVAGFSENGELWKPGKFVTVKDFYKGVVGKFLIKAATYTFSNAGETTVLTITLPDAYTTQPEFTEADKRKSTVANVYTAQQGDTLSSIAVQNNITLDSLQTANPQLDDVSVLQAGQSIKIPGG